MKPAPSLPATADLFRMDGMRILLTGAGGAIGAVLARAFASGLADNGKAAARSPASVADLPPWDMPAHFVL